MKPICQKLQETLASEGSQALRSDEAVRRHLDECPECAAALESLARLDRALGRLPAIDAPDEVVSRLLARVEGERNEAERGGMAEAGSRLGRHVAAAIRGASRARPLFWGLAATAGVVVFVALSVPSLLRARKPSAVVGDQGRLERGEVGEDLGAVGGVAGGVPQSPTSGEGEEGRGRRKNAAQLPNAPLSEEEEAALEALGYVGVDRKALKEMQDQEVARSLKDLAAPGRGVGDGLEDRLERSRAWRRANGERDLSAPVVGETGARVLEDRLKGSEERGRAQGEGRLAARLDAPAEKQVTAIVVPSDKAPDEAKSGSPAKQEVQSFTWNGPHRPPGVTIDTTTSSEAVDGDDAVAGEAKRERQAKAQIEVRSEGKPGDEAGARGPLRVGGQIVAPKKIANVNPTYPEAARKAGVEGVVVLDVTVSEDGRVSEVKIVRGQPLLNPAALAAVKQWRYAPTLLNGRPVPIVMTVTVTFRLAPEKEGDERSALPGGEAARTAQAFLAERARTEGLATQVPRGYWANTYLPGDPMLRLLQARLAAWDRSALEAAAGVPLRLHDGAHQTRQPFDPPRRGALALYLHADRRGLEGPGRVLVQVGLRGSERPGARRPAMSVGLVLDLRGEISPDVAAGMRALALAFSQAREAGDRFQIVVAGRPGGIVVEPDQFKHGPLVVTLARLLEGGEALDGPCLDLADAVATAFQAVSRADDPEAPLGSSTVILVTGQALGSSTETLARLAHQGAVAGIPSSLVAVSPDVPVDEMDLVALAGQGSRRRLESRSEAASLVDQQLASAARVVARAVRLRIRLAPGVRLVEVVGSRPLAEPQAQRVREAERSIDLRLSRNLGIEADRGEDEDGIQIVIPSFQAADAHAILLDVVAPGPGPIAEVTARYKDIVALRNGVARASLRLEDGIRTEGPLERNVFRNRLALRLSRTLERAGERLRAGDPAEAVRVLEEARALRRGLAVLRPPLAGDPELGRDVAMLGEYVRLLRGVPVANPEDQVRLADSLTYAGHLKVLPRPTPVTAPGV